MDESLAIAAAPSAGSPRPLIPLEYAGPFAPPVAARFGAWREGNELVLFDGSALPRRCVKCGGDDRRPRPILLRLAWLPSHMRWVAGFLFVALGFARRTCMEVYLCERCYRRRRVCHRWAVLLLVAGTALLIRIARHPAPELAWAASAAFLTAAFFFRRARPVTVTGLSVGIVRVSGVAAAYLTGLPIGGPPGIGFTSADLADRLARVRDRGRRRRRHRCRKRTRRHRRHRAEDQTVVSAAVFCDRDGGASHAAASTGDAAQPSWPL